MRHHCDPTSIFLRTALLLCLAGPLFAADPKPVQNGASTPAAQAAVKVDTTLNSVKMVLTIPRIAQEPSLEEFVSMEPAGGVAATMAHAENFTQSDPIDGDPATQRTDAYLGYDLKNLYIVFVCRDTDPDKIRARMTRRENAFDDDFVEVTLDTFQDKRRGFIFLSNPLGIQADALLAEGSGMDWSFDTVWQSEGKVTEKGYVVKMAIPFRSLRFAPAQVQSWGVTLLRQIARSNERDFWPQVSSKVNGRLNQAGTLKGMDSISPGRNMQFNPYGIMRTYRALDERGATPRFAGETIAGDVGLDSKIVIKDRFILDSTVNPDFSQVESDEPQVTVNQRFEVFFPEKRPFFLENASYFSTPIDLNFTRRIADPNYGIRLTGKQGKYAVGLMFADDTSPGKSVPRGDPLDGKKAYFGIGRVNRDFGKQNTIGVIYAHRQFQGVFNRVGGVDGRFRWKKNFSANFQAVNSSTLDLAGNYKAGPAYTGYFGYSTRKVNYNVMFNDNGTGFSTRTGFFRRPGIRRISHFTNYRWRPEKSKVLRSFGPNYWVMHLYDRKGKLLEHVSNPGFEFSFHRNSWAGVFAEIGKERLVATDFSTLATDVTYNKNLIGVFMGSDYFKKVGVNAEVYTGNRINFVPSGTLAPQPARMMGGRANLSLKPFDRLQIDNTYILSRLRNPATQANIFNSHTIRTKFNYQFNRELSLRLIAQYNALLTNPANTFLQSRKGVNADVLVTYYLSPGTAVYVGYNSNLSNTDPALVASADGYLATRNRLINDGKQVFIKISYLFRY